MVLGPKWGLLAKVLISEKLEAVRPLTNFIPQAYILAGSWIFSSDSEASRGPQDVSMQLAIRMRKREHKSLHGKLHRLSDAQGFSIPNESQRD